MSRESWQCPWQELQQNDREQKDHGKGNCVCVQHAEVLKRGAAGTPAGRLPVCLRDVSGHVRPTHTVHILREGLFPQVCWRCGLMCVLTWKEFKQNGMACFTAFGSGPGENHVSPLKKQRSKSRKVCSGWSDRKHAFAAARRGTAWFLRSAVRASPSRT